MMNLHELTKHFRFLLDIESYSPEERDLIERFLSREYALKECSLSLYSDQSASCSPDHFMII